MKLNWKTLTAAAVISTVAVGAPMAFADGPLSAAEQARSAPAATADLAAYYAAIGSGVAANPNGPQMGAQQVEDGLAAFYASVGAQVNEAPVITKAIPTQEPTPVTENEDKGGNGGNKGNGNGGNKGNGNGGNKGNGNGGKNNQPTVTETPQTPVTPTATSTKLRVGEYNVLFELSNDAALTTFLRAAQDFDVVGAPEWDAGRDGLAGKLKSAGWGTYRAPGSNTSAMWRTADFNLLETKAERLVEERYVGPVIGKDVRLTARDITSTAVKLEHKATGQKFWFVAVHLPAHIETAGGPRPQATSARIAHFADATLGWANQLDRLDDGGLPVFSVSDTNVDYYADKRAGFALFPVATMASRGYTNAWSAVEQKNRGSHGDRFIDTAYAATKPDNVRVLDGDWASDHRPVVAVYQLG